MNSMLLSILLPCYNEEKNLPIMLDVLQKNLQTMPFAIEILAINDGSTDTTYQTLLSLQKTYPHLHVISFSRNFGKEAAITCGLHRAKGDIVVIMDSDLQHPPSVLPEMLAQWSAGADMVYALRRNREGDGILRQCLTKIFYWVFHKISDLQLPPGAGDFRLMRRKVVDAVNQLPEKQRFMKGLMTWVGFDTKIVHFDAPARCHGTSQWSFKTLCSLALDGIAGFSVLPLRIWSLCGAFTSLFALIYMAVLIIRTCVFGIDVPGYASLMCSILFTGGIQLISLGVIGEYVGRIFHEVKGRPIYIIQDEHKPDSVHGNHAQ